MERDSGSVLHPRHFAATLGAFPARLDTFVHIADLFAILGACVADFGAEPAKTMLKRGAPELKIGRGLADLGAAHQQTEVFRLDVFSARLEAVVHRGLQADLMAMAARIDTGLHRMFRMGCLIH
jgi:hypothetical protein